jgi:CTP synthase (UTP-ammonia lyase)
MPIHLALLGDYDASIVAHRAIPLALRDTGRRLGIGVSHIWVGTEEVTGSDRLAAFDALWCIPGSPYRNMDGALRGLRHARETGLPFLGTCGGFQHALIEYARNVAGWHDAEHAETAPSAARQLITPLACPLVEATEQLDLQPGTAIAQAYGRLGIEESYHCRYGLAPQWAPQLLDGPLRASAVDRSGQVRAVELADHPFYIATLFQPERAALAGQPVALVDALVRAAMVWQASRYPIAPSTLPMPS